MSLIGFATAFGFGMLLGAGGFYFAIPSIPSLGKKVMQMGFKSAEAWILVQRGNSYDLEAVEYEKEANAYKTADADAEEEEWFEDDGMMHSLFKTPFGVAFEDHTAVVDPVISKVAASESAKDDTPDKLQGDEEFAVDELREQLHVGSLERQAEGFKHRIDFINPFVAVEGPEEVVETETTTTTRHEPIVDGGDSDADADADVDDDRSLLQRLGLRSTDTDTDTDTDIDASDEEVTPVEVNEKTETTVKRRKRMDIIDIREITSLLSHAGSPDTPRKTAENAAQAERAFDDWGDLKQSASMIGAAFTGGILVYLGMSGGGGGGGGGGSLPLSVVIDTTSVVLQGVPF
jgi:hypothetical protein